METTITNFGIHGVRALKIKAVHWLKDKRVTIVFEFFGEDGIINTITMFFPKESEAFDAIRKYNIRELETVDNVK
jgi:hypothetical protein